MEQVKLFTKKTVTEAKVKYPYYLGIALVALILGETIIVLTAWHMGVLK